MKKAIKIIRLFLLVIIILNSALYCIGKHGWRLFGFDMCENPDTLYMENVYVTDDCVYIAGNTMSSASSYVGYTYRVKGNTLLVGIKQNLLLGFTDRIGAYSFKIEDGFESIDKILLVGNGNEKFIWSLEADKKWMEKIQRVRIYKGISVETGMDCKKETENADFVYADDELLERIRHAEFSSDIYLSKGDGYLGVAELVNGDEIYLDFERHYNDFFIIGKRGYYSY